MANGLLQQDQFMSPEDMMMLDSILASPTMTPQEAGFAAASTGAMMLPGSSIPDVLGYAPNPFQAGEYLPSFAENVMGGQFFDATMQGVGLLGDAMVAASPLTGGLLAVPGAAMKSARVASVAGKTHPKRISPRLPLKTVKGEKVINTDFGDPLSENLTIGLSEAKIFPDKLEANMGLIKQYPNMTIQQSKLPTEQATEEFIEHAKNNLLYLYDKIPEQTRQRSKLWYEGARRIADQFADTYEVDEASAAGVLAALSPQKDWYQNANLAGRTMDILKNKQDFSSNEMWANIPEALLKPQYNSLRESIQGKKLSELTLPAEKAFWVRLYDETYNGRAYDIVSPEGEFIKPAKNADGKLSQVAWGSLNEISKAVSAYESGGNKEILNRLMGDKHKVRSFYNNILDPMGDQGDVTIDTHAVAAALLRPLAGKSTEVHHNFGSSPGKKDQTESWKGAMKNVNLAGIQGSYPLYAEAYKRAASERGVLPREMQSITWEAARGLFTDTFKRSPKDVSDVEGIWQNYRQGKLSLQEARDAVIERAGRINPPEWE